ncbi:uncharacterized protein LOC144164773 [Haemaphysalis longicornis]
MAFVPRTTAHRHVRRAVENDVQFILAAGEKTVCSAAERFGSPAATFLEVAECCESPPAPREQAAAGFPPVVAPDLSQPDFPAGDFSAAATLVLGSLIAPPNPRLGEERGIESDASCCDDSFMREDPEVTSFKEKLRAWSVEAAVPQATVTKLLKILRTHHCFSELPASARTLLHTPRTAESVRTMDTGQYCHFGLREGLEGALRNVPRVPDPVIINVNVDGLPLTKSTRDQFWPILCQVANCEGSEPFPVGVYYGQAKALKANVFLEPFVTDLKSALQAGVVLGNRMVQLQVGAIICDAPAKSYILSIKGHSGYFSCSKCVTEGDHLQGRMCFPQLDAALRTDASFRSKEQEEHHIGETILEELPIDMVCQIPLDHMHLICLGVMRKLILLWTKGDKSYRIGKATRDSLSGANVESRYYVPSDMSRQPRSLSDVDKWKATEFRLILLYTGVVVLKGQISDSLMDNFLTLHCAVSILSSPKHSAQYLDYAEKLLRHFVSTYITLYGKHVVSHNVHGLIHVADDVRMHGSLHNYSAFPFESYMGKLKKYVRKPEKPLQQLYNRIAEERSLVGHPTFHASRQEESTSVIPSTGPTGVVMTSLHENGPLPLGCTGPQYRSVKISGEVPIMLKTTRRDSACLMKDGSIVKIENIAHCTLSHQPVAVGRKYEKTEDLYSYPCGSSLLDVYLASKP